MGTPIALGRLFGVYLRVDISVFLVAAIFVVNGLAADGISGVLDEVTFVVLLFLSIYLHEMGHAFGARLFGISTLDVTLTFFGGYARLGRPTRGTTEEVVVSFAGPGANLALAALLYWWLNTEQSTVVADHSWQILWRLYYANLVLGIFNLLPGYPLDGGNITRAILTNFMRRGQARLIVGYIGVGIGGLLVLWGLQSGGLGFTMLLGFLLAMQAWQEVQEARNSRF
jgi:Zn-dependent protease